MLLRRVAGRRASCEDEFIITRSKLEEDLIDVGILSNSDYLSILILSRCVTDYYQINSWCDLLSLSIVMTAVMCISPLLFLRRLQNIWGLFLQEPSSNARA